MQGPKVLPCVERYMGLGEEVLLPVCTDEWHCKSKVIFTNDT